MELDLAGWRPRNQAPPTVHVASNGVTRSVRPDRRGESVSLDVVASGLWTSDVVVALDSETFSPGAHDPRRLGVQLRGARLTPTGLGRPPVVPLARAALVALLAMALAGRLGARRRAATALGMAAALSSGGLQAVAPVETAAWSGNVAWGLAGLVAASLILPRPFRAARALAAGIAKGLLEALGRLGPAPVALLIAGGALGVIAAHRLHPRVDFPIGSDRTLWVTSGFGAFDAADGRTFRSARGAVLDLRDFGGGAAWQVVVETSPAQGASAWTATSQVLDLPNGWRPGPRLAIGEGGPAPVRVARVSVDRRGGWPALRLVAVVIVSGLWLGIALSAAGLAARAAIAGAALLLIGATGSLAAAPEVVIPFAPVFLGIATGGALIAAGLAAGGREFGWRHPPGVVAAAAAGFVAWLSSTTFPLYRGGHFLFHSAIAEEIWKGRFLIYYLPYPGSMLSQQAQWGNVIVPHPALYQTLAAPLAALSRPSFLLAEKAVLALLFAALVVVAGRLAMRVASREAGAWAAVTFVGLVPTYQLLGLGHLMTILGVFASSVAFLFLATRLARLGERRAWWTAVALLTFCFLSYFAALLFTGLVLVLYLGWLARREPARVRPLFGVLVVATALSFGLYYAYWFWPFLSESLPALLSGAGEPRQAQERFLMSRLLSQPGKLDYSYGSFLVPLAGLVGLLRLRRAEPRERCLLVLWLLILPIVTGMDLFFNFLLKHHYYVMVPVAVGVGALLERVARLGRPGRVVAVVSLLAVLALGAQTATEVALGLIP